MQIPNEWLNGIVGAIAALAIAKFLGWLNIPNFGGVQQSAGPTSPKPVIFQVHSPGASPAPASAPSYEATVTIPHKITVAPQ